MSSSICPLFTLASSMKFASSVDDNNFLVNVKSTLNLSAPAAFSLLVPVALSFNHADAADFSSIGTLQNTKATNYSGDVLINFSSVTNDDTASIVIEFIKEYDAIS